MPQYPLRIPDDLYQKAQRIAEEQGVSLNQFFLYAVATMAAEIEARAFFRQRSPLTSDEARTLGLRLLHKVPDRNPDPGDEMPSPRRSSRKQAKG